MVISANAESFYGLPIRPLDLAGEPALVTGDVALRIHVGWDSGGGTAVEQIDALAAHPAAASVRALVIGDWGEAATGDDSGAVVSALVRAARTMPALRAVFLGEMTYEECEISWIQHGDLQPLFEIATLEELWVRGGGMQLGPVRHARLKKLVFESGGLPPAVPLALAESELPALEHLELWLGTDEYGGTNDIADVAPLLACDRFPALRHLGLRNSVISDAIAARLCDSPLLARLTSLDLSLGTLGDDGVRALARCSRIAGLERIDVHHHYASDAAIAELATRGPAVIATGAEEPDDGDEEYRYVAHSE